MRSFTDREKHILKLLYSKKNIGTRRVWKLHDEERRNLCNFPVIGITDVGLGKLVIDHWLLAEHVASFVEMCKKKKLVRKSWWPRLRWKVYHGSQRDRFWGHEVDWIVSELVGTMAILCLSGIEPLGSTIKG